MQISYNVMVCEYTEGCGQNLTMLVLTFTITGNCLCQSSKCSGIVQSNDTKQCKNKKIEEAHFSYIIHTHMNIL